VPLATLFPQTVDGRVDVAGGRRRRIMDGRDNRAFAGRSVRRARISAPLLFTTHAVRQPGLARCGVTTAVTPAVHGRHARAARNAVPRGVEGGPSVRCRSRSSALRSTARPYAEGFISAARTRGAPRESFHPRSSFAHAGRLDQSRVH